MGTQPKYKLDQSALNQHNRLRKLIETNLTCKAMHILLFNCITVNNNAMSVCRRAVKQTIKTNNVHYYKLLSYVKFPEILYAQYTIV